MQIENIPLAGTGQLHPLAKAYLENPASLSEYFNFSPDIAGLAEALKTRKQFDTDRELLADKLKGQYLLMDANFQDKTENNQVLSNIELLRKENTFTITTGHQLAIFTGPAYFIYKIISAICYAKQLGALYPEYNFVPVYWMASEDHDFEEINHIHLFGKTLQWDAPHGGAVGRMNPAAIGTLLGQLSEMISRQPDGQRLVDLFTTAYTTLPTLALATRYIVHELFKSDGLVVIDPDDKDLKKQFVNVLKADILNGGIYKAVKATQEKLEANYNLPVNPREINVFYLAENLRARIVKTESGYKADDHKNWTEQELLNELEAQTENFSPNVVLRPMYQETILPNLAYIGGNNEIAYWLELKAAFDSQNVFYPQVLVRDSALWAGKRIVKDMDAFKLEVKDLFIPFAELKKLFYSRNELHHPAEEAIDALHAGYENLRTQAQKLGSDIASQVVKQSNEHQKELKRLSKEIQRKKEEENEKSISRLEKIYESIFPSGSFQERYDNFMPYYLQYGDKVFELLKENFMVTEGKLTVMLDR